MQKCPYIDQLRDSFLMKLFVLFIHRMVSDQHLLPSFSVMISNVEHNIVNFVRARTEDITSLAFHQCRHSNTLIEMRIGRGQQMKLKITLAHTFRPFFVHVSFEFWNMPSCCWLSISQTFQQTFPQFCLKKKKQSFLFAVLCEYKWINKHFHHYPVLFVLHIYRRIHSLFMLWYPVYAIATHAFPTTIITWNGCFPNVILFHRVFYASD